MKGQLEPLLPGDLVSGLKTEELWYLRRHTSRLLSTMSLVKSLGANSILDVGAGSGIFMLLLPQSWKKMIIDLPFNVDKATKLGIKGFGLDLEVEKFPLMTDSIDLVTMLEVIEHVRNKNHVMSEINKVLKEGGYLVITTPDAHKFFWRLRDGILEIPIIGRLVFRMRSGRYPDDYDSHKGCLTRDQLINLVRSHGFVVVGEKRIKIFQPGDDMVIIARKSSSITN